MTQPIDDLRRMSDIEPRQSWAPFAPLPGRCRASARRMPGLRAVGAWAQTAALACVTIGAIALGTASSAEAQAQYPDRPPRVVVPFPAGASLDTMVRTVTQKMSEGLGQNVVVENRSGAGGIVGIGSVAKAPPDGYQFVAVANSFVANTLLRNDLPYDAFKDFAPVTLLGTVPHVLVARRGLAADSVASLVELARRTPDRITFASGGNGTSSHLGAEMFMRAANIRLAHVPYRGQGPALVDVVGGQVDLTLGNMPEVIPHVKSGAIKVLAIVAPKRSPLEPGWPTLAELGYPSVVSDSWFGLMAPAGTPADAIARFQREAARALASPDVRDRLAAQGFVPSGITPDEYRAFLQSTAAAYKQVIEAAKIKLD
ncbi:MAG: tripartite tricarboxylate transporter substrate binding protein [Burkholderiales bacterium]|nr:tripartite tricarboxylate transporter substrate binding protein [Burkholderiales bacterium]